MSLDAEILATAYAMANAERAMRGAAMELLQLRAANTDLLRACRELRAVIRMAEAVWKGDEAAKCAWMAQVTASGLNGFMARADAAIEKARAL
jgi:hypothetical protein